MTRDERDGYDLRWIVYEIFGRGLLRAQHKHAIFLGRGGRGSASGRVFPGRETGVHVTSVHEGCSGFEERGRFTVGVSSSARDDPVGTRSDSESVFRGVNFFFLEREERRRSVAESEHRFFPWLLSCDIFWHRLQNSAPVICGSDFRSICILSMSV